MAIDVSSILKQKIDSAHSKQSKSDGSKTANKSVFSSFKPSLKSPSGDSKQLKELIGYANRLRDDIDHIRKFLIENRRDYIDV